MDTTTNPTRYRVNLHLKSDRLLGGLVAPVLAFFAVEFHLGFAIPMLVGTVVAAFSVVVSLLLSPETKGKVLAAELSVA